MVYHGWKATGESAIQIATKVPCRALTQAARQMNIESRDAATNMTSATPPQPATDVMTKDAHTVVPVVPVVPAVPVVPVVVGVGASAGGLEALELFLKQFPPASGMAIVIVQHLDPTHKGMLPELLQRYTPMVVEQITDGMRVRPNHVYVIPPNKDLVLWKGALCLRKPNTPHGLRLPIDQFLRSLANEQRKDSVGIILSGMGSDGTLGLRAIKEQGGLTMAQDPATAKFDSMPRNAIVSGFVDMVAAPEALPGKLIAFPRHLLPVVSEAARVEPELQSALEQINGLLRDRKGNDFSLYKENTVYRRIERRMGLHQIDTISKYAHFLKRNPQEIDLLFKELLIGVTSFFRDQEVWETLKHQGFKALFAAHPAGKTLRAWVPACSTGEEAYTLAMAFHEALELIKPRGRFSLQIFATDLDQDAISKARQGYFPVNIVADVSVERLSRFFVEEGDGYRVIRSIREMVIFARQNVTTDPPFTRLDILTCRNLLIYLGSALQARLLPLFHYALTHNGLLLLGRAETIGNIGLFAPLDNHSRLYRRVIDPMRMVEIDFPTKHYAAIRHAMDDNTPVLPSGDFQSQADNFLLRQFAPAAVLVSVDGDIVYINGRTGKYLEPAAGKANWNIHAMARDGLRHELMSALHKVAQHGGTVNLAVSCVTSGNGDRQHVNVSVQMIDKPDLLHGLFAIVFTDVNPPETAAVMDLSSIDSVLATELTRARTEIQSLHEQMQTSQEELISMNEELHSTNEELQSTVEELTTSKEEMQSLNEELQTVNAELQSKVDDLSSVNNDMKNLLNSTDIAILFLDGGLNVRRYTNQATGLFKLIPGDIGRPLTDMASELIYADDAPSLKEKMQQVLRTHVALETHVSSRDGRWFTARIMPYHTLENVIDGVVLTFTDNTEDKKREAELNKALQDKALQDKAEG